MFKLYRQLKKIDWVCLVLILGLTILQVYCTILLTDYVSNIVSAITYLNYHNEWMVNPPPIVTALGGLDAIASLSEAELTNIILAGGGDAAEAASSANRLLSIANASTGDIWLAGGIMIAIAVAIAVIQAIISVLASRVAASQATIMREKLARQVASYSLVEINSFSTASLVTRCSNDIQQVQIANIMIIRMILSAPITAIWAICRIQASSMELTLVTAIVIFCLILVISILMILVIPKFKRMQTYIDRLNGVAREHLTGIRVVHAFNKEDYTVAKEEKANEALTRANLYTSGLMSILSPAMTLAMNALTLLIYWVGAGLILNQSIDYATITSFMMLGSQIVMSFLMLLMMFVLWPRASVSAKRINEVLETESSIVDPVTPKEETEYGTLEFKDVSFHYPGGDGDVLKHISFKAKKGDVIAFIGPTGSGKTSLVNLITRQFDATDGEILVDGVNIKDLPLSKLRGKFGYVPQKGLLFSGSVKENIGLGVEDISDEEAHRAAKIACADEFINKMDKGLESFISQGGKNVSGGQRQRLCIARAVAIHPEFYLFDDSFSALDYKTDKMVRENIAKEEGETTRIIVATRIGTIMDADLIVVLEDGEAVGIGKHQELLKTCPVYLKTALSQLSKEELGL